MKESPMPLLDRLELAAQACRAAHLLSCEQTCRDAVTALSATQDKRDAERYRFLRLQMATAEGVWIAHGVIGNLSCWNGAQADVMIDAAMGSTDGGGQANGS